GAAWAPGSCPGCRARMNGQDNPMSARVPASSGKPGGAASPTTATLASAWHAEEREGFSRPRYGVYVNNRAAVFMGEAFSLDRLLDNALLTEQAGLDFVSVGDSITAKPRYAAIPLLSAIAPRTSRLGLATGILQPHMRQPVL